MVGIAEPHPLSPQTVARAAGIAHRAGDEFTAGGYAVQTVRLSTRPVFGDMAAESPGRIVRYTSELCGWLGQAGIGYCSLGPAPASSPDFPVKRIDFIPDMLIGAEAVSCSVQLATSHDGVRGDAAEPVARTIRRLACGTPKGLGNFRFAALACVGPGGPFFPAAYHDGPASLTVGLQGASVVARAVRGGPGGDDTASDPSWVTERVRRSLVAAVQPVVALGRRAARRNGLRFGGVDLSPAPAGDDSIGAAIEEVAGPFGGFGTLAAIGAITRGVRQARLPRCGFSGLMLPVLEDVVLARRWAERRFDPHRLLAYSAVCGTGLDTVPLPGNIGDDEIAGLLLDVATLAVQWNKPLSARLFLALGRKSGDPTSFDSPHLVDSVVY